MRFWFIDAWAYVCFAGLMLMVLTLRGINPTVGRFKIASRVLGAVCGLAVIVWGIWMNLR